MAKPICRCVAVWLLCLGIVCSAAAAPSAPTAAARPSRSCSGSTCATAVRTAPTPSGFLDRLRLERPALRIVYRSVDRDAAARDELVALSSAGRVAAGRARPSWWAAR